MCGCRFSLFPLKLQLRSNDKVLNRRLIVNSLLASRRSSSWPSKHGAGRALNSGKRNGEWHFRLRMFERSQKKGAPGESSHRFHFFFIFPHRWIIELCLFHVSRESRAAVSSSSLMCLWRLHTLQMKTHSKRMKICCENFVMAKKNLFFIHFWPRHRSIVSTVLGIDSNLADEKYEKKLSSENVNNRHGFAFILRWPTTTTENEIQSISFATNVIGICFQFLCCLSSTSRRDSVQWFQRISISLVLILPTRIWFGWCSNWRKKRRKTLSSWSASRSKYAPRYRHHMWSSLVGILCPCVMTFRTMFIIVWDFFQTPARFFFLSVDCLFYRRGQKMTKITKLFLFFLFKIPCST